MIKRRETLAGLGAVAATTLLPSSAVHAAVTPRQFNMFRNGKKVGEQRIFAELTPSGLEAKIEIDLVLRILGVAVWRYNLQATELWRGGKLISLRSRTNNNGKDQFVNAKRVAGGVQVQGSKFQGLVKGSPVTSTYWNSAFMQNPVWINVQHGKPEDIAAQNAGKTVLATKLGKIDCDVWQTTGKLKLKIFFDRSKEFVGYRVPIKDSQVEASITHMGGDFSSLWDRS